MIGISSQPLAPSASPLAAATLSALTFGASSRLRGAADAAEAERRAQLQDLRLAEPLRELLDRAFREQAGGSVEHRTLTDGRFVTVQASVGLSGGCEIVLLQVPGTVLKDGSRIPDLLRLGPPLRGRTARFIAPDLNGLPASAFNGLKQEWEQESPARRILVDFIPFAHLEELQRGEALLTNVLQFDPSAPAPGAHQAAEPTDLPAAPPRPHQKTVRIFLASSAELREDRDAFDLYFRQQNDRLRQQGCYLEIKRWEYFLDAMSPTRLQDEYNQTVRQCDIFVSLFMTKTGRYTEEEFDVAHRQFTQTGRPFIYTFFKNAQVRMASIDDEILSLLNFKQKLKQLGHFHTDYDDIEHLKRQFRDQLDRLLPRI